MFFSIPLLFSLAVCESVSSGSTRKVAVHDDRAGFTVAPVDECYYTWNANTENLIATTTILTLAYTSTHDLNTDLVYCLVEGNKKTPTPTPQPFPLIDVNGFEKLLDPEKQTNTLIMLAQAFVLIFCGTSLQKLIPAAYSCISKIIEALGMYSVLAFWVARAMEASAKVLQIPKTITYAVVCSQLLLAAL